MNFKKIGKLLTSKFVGTGPTSYEKRIYRAAVLQRLRNTDLEDSYPSPWFDSMPITKDSQERAAIDQTAYTVA